MSRPPPSPNIEIDAVSAARVRRKLLAWFDRHKRDLPWRRTRDPYRVWLSEIMLQQTQVATVIPYYRRFLRRLPTVERLAAAHLDEVLRLWAGLGYYSRARNLHRSARRIVGQADECSPAVGKSSKTLGGSRGFGRRFPKSVEALMSLPGIGRYTAGAIASIAFGRRAAVVDGNVGRVIARLFEIRHDIRSGPGARRVWGCAEQLLPRKRCGDFNQALMELGATVCLPGPAARCESCPLRRECAARASGRVAELPAAGARARVTKETHVVAAIEHRGKWLFVRRAEHGLWGGLWELPTAVLNGESPRALAQRIANDVSPTSVEVSREPFCDLEHQLTHRRIRLLGHVCWAVAADRRSAPDVTSGLTPDGRGSVAAGVPAGRESTGTARRAPATRHAKKKPQGRWLRLDEVGRLGLSAAMRKVLRVLGRRSPPRENPSGSC